jgi:Uma2 family endonuclease
MAGTKLVTADELFCMPEEDRFELVRGVLVPMSPQPGFRHGRIGSRLAMEVGVFVRVNRLGTCVVESGFRLARDPDTVLGPDFAFVARGRITADMDQTRYLPLAPDLVAEVVSPSDSVRRITERVQEYLDAGVRLVWVLDPRSESVRVHRPGQAPRTLSKDDVLSGEDVLPGFACRVADLFADAEGG